MTNHTPTGAQHSAKSKQSMEVFAQLREEIRHLRRVNADLLEACQAAKSGVIMRGREPDGLSNDEVADMLEFAINKATASTGEIT